MKKVMVMFAALAMAFAASATTFAWGISGGGALDADKFAGASAYLFYGVTAGPTVDTAVESFTVADVTKSGATQYQTGKLSADGTFYDTSLGNVTSVGGKTGAVYFYMAVISDDGKYVALTAPKSVQIRNTTTAGSATWGTANFTTYTAEGGVPEPTSGLLLLVGGAMLALRRRRA